VSAQTATADPEQELIDEIALCYNDPLRYVLFAFPWGEAGSSLANEDGPDDWQVDICDSIKAALEDGEDASTAIATAIRVAVASGHGIGKTALIAWLIKWFMATREFPQIVVTASGFAQLSNKTWRELAKWHRMSIDAHWYVWTATKYYHVQNPSTWFAAAIPWSEHNPDAFAGTHEKHVLIIYDEAQAIADSIWSVTEGAMTTAGVIWIAFGNYSKNTGRFHECFAGKTRDRWIRRQIDSRKCRHANKAQIQEWVDDYGEDSDFVRVRVRGIAPRSGSNQFIGQDLVDICATYKADGYETAPKIISLDVARKGTNKSVAVLRQGRKWRTLKKWSGLPTDQLTDRFIELIEEENPDAIIVDGDGIGGAVIDNLVRRGYDKKDGKTILYEFHGAQPAHDECMYFNRRAECYGLLKDAMRQGVEKPDDPELDGDLTATEYFYVTRSGHDVIQLESKKDMQGRGIASPDNSDAYMMTYSIKLASRRAPPKGGQASSGRTSFMAD
jgi:hypothetical protein